MPLPGLLHPAGGLHHTDHLVTNVQDNAHMRARAPGRIEDGSALRRSLNQLAHEPEVDRSGWVISGIVRRGISVVILLYGRSPLGQPPRLVCP